MVDYIKDAIYDYIKNNDNKLDRIDVVSHFKLSADVIYDKINTLVMEKKIIIYKYPTAGEPGKHRLVTINRMVDCICDYMGPSKLEDDLFLCPECDTSFITLEKEEEQLPSCVLCGGELIVRGEENGKKYCICKICNQDRWV